MKEITSILIRSYISFEHKETHLLSNVRSLQDILNSRQKSEDKDKNMKTRILQPISYLGLHGMGVLQSY